MIFFVDFFIYFINNVAVCKLFTPFMRCESNLKVKVDRKQGNLIAYPWSRIRNTAKTFSEEK